MKMIEGGVCAAKGFRAAGMHCGIRKDKSRLDLALIAADRECAAAALYTTNKVKSAPIYVTRDNLSDGRAMAVVANSGNANACVTGGQDAARKMCAAAAKALSIKPEDVIVASTGVIGQPLKVEFIEAGIPELAGKLEASAKGANDAACAIMTTDTFKKEAAVEFEISGKTARIGGMAKGSGMISPKMATMLCFITTDAAISAKMLETALRDITDRTFNCVSVDGDTSTNDTVAVMANGMAGNDEITSEGADFDAFRAALLTVCTSLCRDMAKDGEGATKLIECLISHAPDEETARVLSKSVINSSLVKTAFFGADANWGRILCALGYADAPLTVEKVKIELSSPKGTILVCENGQGVDFSEEKAKEILLENEIKILIDLHDGDAEGAAFGCDLSYEYVRINGDYRT
ncbi:MAG: bifunctional ornithine acetyltransferase/N-acetylglutamate synthase [Clostridia bacterium]|nr:bifunctional ornithine acetyltransferase/N-acetylglutamate synthase [Clostridia bacterium]